MFKVTDQHKVSGGLGPKTMTFDVAKPPEYYQAIRRE